MKSEFTSAFGIAFQVFKSLADEVKNLGGTDEDLRLIETDRDLRRKVAQVIVNRGYVELVCLDIDEAMDAAEAASDWTPPDQRG